MWAYQNPAVPRLLAEFFPLGYYGPVNMAYAILVFLIGQAVLRPGRALGALVDVYKRQRRPITDPSRQEKHAHPPDVNRPDNQACHPTFLLLYHDSVSMRRKYQPGHTTATGHTSCTAYRTNR